MEKRQLDFNAPLLSARRFSSPRNSSELVVQRKVLDKRVPPGLHQPLPLNKSDWESDDITKPASVPFNWEQSPGRPKNEARTRPREPSDTPRLPPGRLSGPSKYTSGERSNGHMVSSFSDHASLLEKLAASLKCNDESDSESEQVYDDTYSDAINTISLAETCNVSGVSGYHDSGVKPSGTFGIDKQTLDFMMDRFLPAAKAAVLEIPQYVVAKKPPVSNEKVKEVKRAGSGEVVKPTFRKYGLDDPILPYYRQQQGFDNVESEDEEDRESGAPVKKSGKAWGILPRICAKSTLCLLNPMPAMKSKSRPPTPSAGEERIRMRRNAVSGPLDKNGCQVPSKKKYHSGSLSPDLLGFENKSSNDSYPLLNSRESARSGLSPLRRYRSGSISPYRNESPKSAFREGAGFLGLPNKEVEDFNASQIASSRKLFKALQDVSKNQTNAITADPVEKTVYVDSVNKTVVGSEIRKTSSRYADEARDIERYLSVDREPRDIECDDEVEQKLVLLDKDGECDLPLKSLFPPPLPKSPSESWLWRTLPLGNPFVGHSHRNNSQLQSNKKQGRKGSDAETKWETIVKSSKSRHDHARHSERTISHASYRQSKS
ncbi:hypothetical protein OROGR_003065 [Orobanche gracilis]